MKELVRKTRKLIGNYLESTDGSDIPRSELLDIIDDLCTAIEIEYLERCYSCKSTNMDRDSFVNVMGKDFARCGDCGKLSRDDLT